MMSTNMNKDMNKIECSASASDAAHIRDFRFFCAGSFLYSLFYTFCLYRNSSGITYPFFIGGTLFFFFLSLKRLGISAKKDSAFYIVSLLLLGISTFCTDDGSLLFMNKMGIFVLSFVLMLHQFHRDGGWNLSKYLSSIFQTVFGSLRMLGSPLSDFSLYRKSRKEGNGRPETKTKYILMGMAVSIPLVLVVLILLYTADVVFASLLDQLLIHIRIPEHFAGILFTVLFSFFASYCISAYLRKGQIREEMADKRTGEPIIAITFTSLLSVIYLLFCGIQILYLFTGNMALPNGYGYADYAREGFFQLLFVCVINLALVLVCVSRFKKSRILRGLLTLISLCTYIMTVSSAMRMLLYIQYYYLTFLRIFVLWSLFVILLLVTGMLIHIYKEGFPLFKYSMLVVTVLYIGLSFSHPDYLIASYNTSSLWGADSGAAKDSADVPAVRPDYSDVYYLSHLSADAAPVLLSDEALEYYRSNRLPYLDDRSWIDTYINRLTSRTEDISFRSFNVSRFTASRCLPD